MRKNYSQYTDYDNYTMLSEHEIEILKMKQSGMSHQEIADNLSIKKNSVSIYLTNIVSKIEGRFDYQKVREINRKCQAVRMANPEYADKMREYKRDYKKRNRDKINKRKREYYHKNQEYFLDYQKKYREKTREYRREYQKKYYSENIDKMRKYHREYQKILPQT